MIPTLLRLLGLAIAIVLILRWLQSRKQNQSGFEDAVENPDLWDSMNEHFQQRDRELEQARHWSDDEIALALEQYVFKLHHSDDDHDEWFEKLSQQPEKASGLALQALGDPDLQSRLRREPRGEPALFRAVELLMLAPSKKAPAQVRRLLTASDERVRGKAMQWLAQVADGTCVDELLDGLRNQASRANVLNGLLQGKHPPGSRIAIDMFQPLATLLTEQVDDDDDYELATELLLGWDRERALAHLEEAGILNPAHKAFSHSLRAMLTAGVSLSRERLHGLWQVIEQPGGSKFDALPVLQMLASHRNESDLPLLHDIFEREHPTSEAAAKALLTYHNLQNWAQTVAHLPRNQRSDAQQKAIAAFHYDSNVRGGGHSQFFFNSSGDNWQETLTALESVGDLARLQILSEAISRFPEPPSSDRETRQIQLARLTQASGEPFDDLDARYNAVPRPAEVSIARLVLPT